MEYITLMEEAAGSWHLHPVWKPRLPEDFVQRIAKTWSRRQRGGRDRPTERFLR